MKWCPYIQRCRRVKAKTVFREGEGRGRGGEGRGGGGEVEEKEQCMVM